MKQPDAPDQRALFAAWLREQIIKCGYDLDARGEQARFARDSGMPSANITRLLKGDTTPDIRSLRQLAPALRRPLAELLIRAGLATEQELAIPAPAEADLPPMTPEQAVDRLHIKDPKQRAALITMISAVWHPPKRGGH